MGPALPREPIELSRWWSDKMTYSIECCYYRRFCSDAEASCHRSNCFPTYLYYREPTRRFLKPKRSQSWRSDEQRVVMTNLWSSTSCWHDRNWRSSCWQSSISNRDRAIAGHNQEYPSVRLFKQIPGRKDLVLPFYLWYTQQRCTADCSCLSWTFVNLRLSVDEHSVLGEKIDDIWTFSFDDMSYRSRVIDKTKLDWFANVQTSIRHWTRSVPYISKRRLTWRRSNIDRLIPIALFLLHVRGNQLSIGRFVNR